MPRLLCLAQANRLPKSRARAGSKGAKAEPQHPAFTILERVPVRLAAHSAVWAALRKHGAREAIVDTEHPRETFPAYVVGVDQLSGDGVQAIAEVLAERRAIALAAEKDVPGGDVLAKHLDRLYEQEMEWLAIRNLLAGALSRGAAQTGKQRKKPARALLLIDL